MPASLNVVCVSGYLTKDPELRHLPSGTSVCQMRIAVNDRFKDQDGTWKDRPFFFDVSSWGGQGENCAKYLSKGSGIMVQGQLRWREWETDGNKRQAVDINARDIVFMPKGGGGRDDSGGGDGSFGTPPAPAGGAGFGVPSSTAADDDDIPF